MAARPSAGSWLSFWAASSRWLAAKSVVRKAGRLTGVTCGDTLFWVVVDFEGAGREG